MKELNLRSRKFCLVYIFYFWLLENAFINKNPDPIKHKIDIALKTYCPEAIPL
jgi:hypothetical protein